MKEEWIRDHYHCPVCGSTMECWKAFPWNVNVGVSRLGGCHRCGKYMIEYENSLNVWLEPQSTPVLVKDR